MFNRISPVSFRAIQGLAIKSKSNGATTPIEIPDGEKLTLLKDTNNIRLSTDPYTSYASVIIKKVDNNSELVIENVPQSESEPTKISPAKQLIFNNVDNIKDQLIKINDFIHDNPEVAFKEFKACEILTKTLKENGFEVKQPVAGLDTAFEATYVNKKEGGPVIGILAEYDALPEAGHACGHNIIASSAIGSALALAKSLGNTSATIKVFGTPAEESEGGKINMIQAGLFDKCDVILMTHPLIYTSAGIKNLALQDMKIVYKGKAAHASTAYNGISALAGAQSFLNGIDSLRQFVRPDARLHGIITHGGDAPNIVPERVEIEYTARAADTDYLKVLMEKVFKVAKGAALMTGTEVTIETKPMLENNLVVSKLANLLMDNAKIAGAERIKEPEVFGSTDFGNVTNRIPAECLAIEFVPLGTPGHTQAWVDAGVSPEGHKAVITSAKTMAATAYDLITNPQLMQEIKDQFKTIKDTNNNQ